MRDYAIIRSKFWSQGSGKRLRGNPEAQVLALYMMSCSQGTLCGIFPTNLVTISHETGIKLEKLPALFRDIAEIAQYDDESELAWVPNTAREQIGESLSPRDNRRCALVRELSRFQKHKFGMEFASMYSEAYELEGASKGLRRGFEGAPKPLVQSSSVLDLDQVVTPETESEITEAISTIKSADISQSPVNCPSKPINDDALATISGTYGASLEAVTDMRREFVVYWTVGKGIGRRHTLGQWAAKCRERICGELERQRPSKVEAFPKKPQVIESA